jgi:hypothetical protein
VKIIRTLKFRLPKLKTLLSLRMAAARCDVTRVFHAAIRVADRAILMIAITALHSVKIAVLV